MTNRRVYLLGGLALCATTVIAWQGGMAVAGWTDADAPHVAETFLSSNANDLPGVYLLKPQARKALEAMGGPAAFQNRSECVPVRTRCRSSPSIL